MQTSKDAYKLTDTQQVILEGLEPQLYKLIMSSGSNAQTIIEYTNSARNEISISYNYEKNNIKTLLGLSKFHSNKNFKESARK